MIQNRFKNLIEGGKDEYEGLNENQVKILEAAKPKLDSSTWNSLKRDMKRGKSEQELVLKYGPQIKTN
jgi:hypothetical protein